MKQNFRKQGNIKRVMPSQNETSNTVVEVRQRELKSKRRLSESKRIIFTEIAQGAQVGPAHGSKVIMSSKIICMLMIAFTPTSLFPHNSAVSKACSNLVNLHLST